MPDEEVDRLLAQAGLRLEAARHLLMNDYYDDAVSRAYYSMYFAATALLLSKNIQVKTTKKSKQNLCLLDGVIKRKAIGAKCAFGMLQEDE